MMPQRISPDAVVSPLTREDRRSLALHAVVAQRLAERPDVTVARAKATLQRMRVANPDASKLLREWDLILHSPLADVLAVLCDPSERARELRHATPFAGVLSPRERADVYREIRRAEVSAQ